MSEGERFHLSLQQLKARFDIPHNVLHYFLKENNGDVSKCIEDLERNKWFKRRHTTSDVEPAKVVETFQRTNTQGNFLSSSHDSANLSSALRQRPGVREERVSPSNYPEVFSPHPPYLPSSVSPNDRQQTNEMYNYPDMERADLSTIKSLSETMPVQVPYTGQTPARRPGYGKQFSEADKERIIRCQRQSSQSAKVQREEVVARLERLKRELGQRNDELRTLRTENNRARVPKEDDVQLTQIIIDTLKMDINDEEDKKRKNQDWACIRCSYINGNDRVACDLCYEPRPVPPHLPGPAAQQPPTRPAFHPPSTQFTSPSKGQGYNYR